MNADAHNTIDSKPSIREMMTFVFGDGDNLPFLDVQPAVRALNAQLRGRSTISARRRAARLQGQSNPLAQALGSMRFAGCMARRRLPVRWWRACRIELGLAAALAGRELTRRPFDSAKLDDATASAVTIPVAFADCQHARERDRGHGVTYVHHFPARAAHSRSLPAVISAA